MTEQQQYHKAIPFSFIVGPELMLLSHQFKETDDPKSPLLSLLPSGVAIGRVFFCGVLLEVRRSKDNPGNISAVVMDRTGTKVFVKASQEYSPEPFSFLTGVKEVPCLIGLTGRPALWKPEPKDGEEQKVFVSINAQSVGPVTKADRYDWDIEAFRLLKERYEAWSDDLTDYQKMSLEVYGQEARDNLLKVVSGVYQEKGLI
jgi:uncharacterized protein